ncbi:LacI family DNA-binding transcriptional regulator [Curtobacterium ammoniigenes]|uniref:LacI family DNA-binding transcriptional regulator n=1 Tax=Curtobacterium ammoniigenes TaxID=395387 RepID=UPI000832FE9D|nr:LacI family DNA-binding transcriptional regulator [Curtobacterium ammoniigenes]
MPPRPPATRPTLSHVAQTAGTSVPTVSKVLRGGTDVSAETRARVMQAVQSVGYTRKSIAGPERPIEDRVPASVIDLVVTHFEGSWANLTLAGVGRAATAAGLDLVVTLAEPGTDWVARVLRRRSMGVVVALVDPTSHEFATLTAAGLPVVLIESQGRPPRGAASIGVANWDGGRLAAEHLVGLGHRHLGVIAGHRSHIYSRARVDGFRAAAEAALGTAASVTVRHGAWDPDRSAEATHQLLDVDPAISAIFACSDPMALGVYAALADRGLRIPEDVSVIGFDDLPEAHWISPAMTTVRQPTAALGTEAVRMLLELARAEDTSVHPRARMELATELVVRASTAAARSE